MSDDKVVYLSDVSDDGRHWSVEDVLEEALAGVKSGKRQANKALVLFLDDRDDGYDVGFAQAGMSCSEMVALLAVFQRILIAQMGF